MKVTQEDLERMTAEWRARVERERRNIELGYMGRFFRWVFGDWWGR